MRRRLDWEERADELRRELRECAKERAEAVEHAEHAAARVRRTLPEAGLYLSMTEVARLLEMDRSSMYRTYVEQ